MRRLNPLKSRQLVILGMLCPSLLLGIVGWLQWKSVRDYREAREWVKHTRIFMYDEECLASSLNAAESGQRGYLLTHRNFYLQPYLSAPDRCRALLKELLEIVRIPDQRANLESVQPLMDYKLGELAQTVALEQQNNHAGAMAIVLNDSGQNTMADIRNRLQVIHDLSRERLTAREEAYQTSSDLNSELSDLLILAGLIVIVGIFFLLRRLDRMQAMIKICAWSKLIEYDGQWLSIEEYLTQRFKAQITHGMSDVEAKKMLALLQQERPDRAADAVEPAAEAPVR